MIVLSKPLIQSSSYNVVNSLSYQMEEGGYTQFS